MLGTRIKKAKLPAAAIKAFGTDAQLSVFAKVTGNSIAAAKGYMLVKLKKTKVIFITNDSGAISGATVYAEAVTSQSLDVLNRGMVTYVQACWCGEGAGDTCRFGRQMVGGVESMSLNVCGGQACCKIDCYEVD